MGYQLFLLVEDMTLARQAVDQLTAGGVDAYLEDATDYTKQPLKIEWSVMVDKSNVKKAEHLLKAFMAEYGLECVSQSKNDYDDSDLECAAVAEPDLDLDNSMLSSHLTQDSDSSQSSRQPKPSYQYESSSDSFSVWKLLAGLFAIVILCGKAYTYCNRHEYQPMKINTFGHSVPYYGSDYGKDMFLKYERMRMNREKLDSLARTRLKRIEIHEVARKAARETFEQKVAQKQAAKSGQKVKADIAKDNTKSTSQNGKGKK